MTKTPEQHLEEMLCGYVPDRRKRAKYVARICARLREHGMLVEGKPNEAKSDLDFVSGDLTDEMIERAAKAIWATRYPESRPDIAESTWAEVTAPDDWMPEALDAMEEARAALAAARVAPIQVFACPDSETYVTGCNDGYKEGLRAARDVIFDPEEDDETDSIRFSHAIEMIDGLLKAGKPSESVAPVTPSEVQHCWTNDGETWCGAAAERRQPETAAEAFAPVCATCHRRVMHHHADSVGMLEKKVTELAARTRKPASSPDREKLAHALAAANALLSTVGRSGVEWTLLRGGEEARFTSAELRVLVDALAVPPVVNEAKLAEIIGEHLLDRYDTDTDLEVCACSVATEEHEAHIAAVLVERQHEWLGDAR